MDNSEQPDLNETCYPTPTTQSEHRMNEDDWCKAWGLKFLTSDFCKDYVLKTVFNLDKKGNQRFGRKSKKLVSQ